MAGVGVVKSEMGQFNCKCVLPRYKASFWNYKDKAVKQNSNMSCYDHRELCVHASVY